MLAATALWWRILLDPLNRALDDEFSTAVERAIRTTEAWTERAPDDAEAWFYLGGAYAARVQWRVLREETVAAARDGKRIKQALERAIELAPGLEDAYFGIGLYQVLRGRRADRGQGPAVLPACCPAATRRRGSRRCCARANGGRLLQGEADYQLHLIYLWYEQQPARALELLRGLQKHYPGQSAVSRADRRHPGHLPARRHRQPRHLARAAGARARAARQRSRRWRKRRRGSASRGSSRSLQQTDHAIELLQGVVIAAPAGAVLARSRRPTCDSARRTIASARAPRRWPPIAAPLAAAPPDDPLRGARARRRSSCDGRRTPAQPRRTGSRSKAGGASRTTTFPRAAAALEQSLALNAAGSGRALPLRARARRHAATMPARSRTSSSRSATRARVPRRFSRRRTSKRRVCTSAPAVAHEAIAAYRTATTLFGAAEETRNAATRALARLDEALIARDARSRASSTADQHASSDTSGRAHF